MTDPISRTELYQRVDAIFHESYPDAPQQLRADSPAYLREAWIRIRDGQLNEEVNRVYWARYPDAPTQLDATSPDWEKWRVSWMNIWHELMDNAPEPEDVQLQNAVSEDGTLDLSHLKAAIRERLVDLENDGTLLADTMDEVVRVCDELAEEVGAQAMRDGGVDGQWQSREVVVHGLGAEQVRISVKGWWVDHYFSGGISALIVPVDGGG